MSTNMRQGIEIDEDTPSFSDLQQQQIRSPLPSHNIEPSSVNTKHPHSSSVSPIYESPTSPPSSDSAPEFLLHPQHKRNQTYHKHKTNGNYGSPIFQRSHHQQHVRHAAPPPYEPDETTRLVTSSIVVPPAIISNSTSRKITRRQLSIDPTTITSPHVSYAVLDDTDNTGEQHSSNREQNGPENTNSNAIDATTTSSVSSSKTNNDNGTEKRNGNGGRSDGHGGDGDDDGNVEDDDDDDRDEHHREDESSGEGHDDDDEDEDGDGDDEEEEDDDDEDHEATRALLLRSRADLERARFTSRDSFRFRENDNVRDRYILGCSILAVSSIVFIIIVSGITTMLADTNFPQLKIFSAWPNGGVIPLKYGCHAPGGPRSAISFPLRWKNVPPSATNLVILFANAGAMLENYEDPVHWLVTDIPLNRDNLDDNDGLPENASADASLLPSGAQQLPNMFSRDGKYWPPCTRRHNGSSLFVIHAYAIEAHATIDDYRDAREIMNRFVGVPVAKLTGVYSIPTDDSGTAASQPLQAKDQHSISRT